MAAVVTGGDSGVATGCDDGCRRLGHPSRRRARLGLSVPLNCSPSVSELFYGADDEWQTGRRIRPALTLSPVRDGGRSPQGAGCAEYGLPCQRLKPAATVPFRFLRVIACVIRIQSTGKGVGNFILSGLEGCICDRHAFEAVSIPRPCRPRPCPDSDGSSDQSLS